MHRPKFFWNSLLAFIVLYSLSAFTASATHIVGGELVYEYIGNDQYAVTLIVYRDCLGGQAAFDDPASIGVYDDSNTLTQSLSFNLDSVVLVPSSINSSCVTAPNDVCVEAGYYTQIVTLPPTAGGYTLAYQRCCRNEVVQNIQVPEDVGATYVATIPGQGTSPDNSSPVWNQLPPLYVCVGLPFEFDHSATDFDGDSLVYTLCTPFEGGTPNAPMPVPPSDPPYSTVSWEPPYALNDMLGGPAPLTIDPQTGQLTATADAVGTFLIGLCVQEYRNGVLLGETRRGIQINVVNCEAPTAAPQDLNEVSPNSFTNCTEFVEFNATGSTGFNIFWDFGDPTTTSDQSTDQSPTYTYPSPGEYDLTLVVFNPINPADPLCTDTLVQTITIRPPVVADAGSDQESCPNTPFQIGSDALPGYSYEWMPASLLDDPALAEPTASITDPITFGLTATDAVGCTATDSVEVDLLENTTADAGAGGTVCEGVPVNLQASGGVSFEWAPAAGLSDPSVPDPSALPSSSTEYVVSVTDANGCVASDTVNVEVFVPQVSPDVAICVGDSAQLSVDNGVSWFWSPVFNLSGGQEQFPTATPASTTTYSVTVDDGTGCLATDSVTVTVNSLPIASAGNDVQTCEGVAVGLQGNGGMTYEWSPMDQLDDPTVQNPLFLAEEDAVYQLTVTDMNGCSDQDSVLVTVNPLPDVSAGTDTTICENGSVQLDASGADQYQWSPAVGLSDPQAAQPLASPLQPVTYVLTGTDSNGCVASDSVRVDVFLAFAGSGGTICAGDSLQVAASDGVTYDWQPAASVSDPSGREPFLFPQEDAEYTVTVTSEFGCVATASVEVEVQPVPVADLSIDAEPSCEGWYVEIQNLSSGADSFLWYLPNGDTSTVFEPSFQVPFGDGPVVSLVAYEADGFCSDSTFLDQSNLTFSDEAVLVDAANVFTPDFDGINDCFRPGFEGRFSDCYGLTVYNRWGELIFRSTAGQEHCWDGFTRGGILAPEGTYYYVAEVKGAAYQGSLLMLH